MSVQRCLCHHPLRSVCPLNLHTHIHLPRSVAIGLVCHTHYSAGHHSVECDWGGHRAVHVMGDLASAAVVAMERSTTLHRNHRHFGSGLPFILRYKFTCTRFWCHCSGSVWAVRQRHIQMGYAGVCRGERCL